MVKEFQIGKEMVKFKSSAALPVLYRQLTGRDFFSDTQSMTDGNSGIVIDMAWVMHRHACPDDLTEELPWLERFEFMDLNNVLVDVADMINAEEKTTSSAKKKSEK